MHIIIVGCGKVGRTLADQLQEEDTDLTLIDTDPDVINDLTEDIDAMGIVGNGASINTLMEAGVKTADIMIAVTASDELKPALLPYCTEDRVTVRPSPVYVIRSTAKRSVSSKSVSDCP